MTQDVDLTKFLTRERHRVHLIGVAGSGMSGIAGLLLQLGHEVSGSDKLDSLETDRLQRLGLKFYRQHRAEDAREAELIVYSSAIRPDNPILKSANDNGKRAARRAEALAAIMSAKRGILIVGMHGKTTTSAMTAHVLREGGLHPSHYVGAEIPILGTNSHWDSRGEYFVAEGDESDGTIALFHPEHAVVLNIEEEHLDFYADLAAIEKTFNQLLGQTSGKIFFCADEPNSARICRSYDRVLCYGLSENGDYCATDVDLRNFESTFRVHRGEQTLGEATLNVPGEHNVRNALGVIALATELGVPFEKIAKALTKFRHARRRFEIKYDSPRFLLVDDYGHHPTEIKATLKTARSVGRKRVLTMFQPHRYSRTQKLRKDFGSAFDLADRVVITDIYGSSESPIAGVTGQLIADEIAARGHGGVSYQPRLEWVHHDVGNMLESG
ncbi:MAG TPA: UDP-N-acetylmuramate--L-alanine ligase, partial [Chthoniobacterales bacterium]|nr:UDP-N-acetylmuramate--L-alanine ligase [Chthoniobacterales bacterium]